MLDWLTLKFMKYQLRKVEKDYKKETNAIIKTAIAHSIKSYKTAIMFLEAYNK